MLAALGLAMLWLWGASAPDATGAAKQQAQIGRDYLSVGRLAEAKSACDAALKIDPANTQALNCLAEAGSKQIDRDLNQAEAALLVRDENKARALSAKWTHAASERQRTRAWSILRRARRSPQEWFRDETPEWLRQVLVTGVLLALLWILLLLLRRFWRMWQRGELSKSKKWSLYPIKELPAAGETGLATGLVLDALGRLGKELARPSWEPKLLLLRPTPPAEYEPAIIDEFLSASVPSMVLLPSPRDLRGEWELHDVELDQAVQNLQFKTSEGIDVGSIARLVRGVFEWFRSGSPTIHGVAQTKDQPVFVHLSASGGRMNSAAVTASTESAPGIDPLQMSAERAALKFLLRMRYPELSTDEVDGFAALRQGVMLFSQYAGTVPGSGHTAVTRSSLLEKAAFNFSFFRASIPVNCDWLCKATIEVEQSVRGSRGKHSDRRHGEEATSLQITEGIRQAVLLAEGVAHALVAGGRADAVTADENRMAAIDCFRQLEDWPGSPETEWMRKQATYNEAVVWRETGAVQRSVLLLTELLGEKAPDTLPPNTEIRHIPCSESTLPQAICFCARVARLSGLAQYTADDWSTFPDDRAELIISDGRQVAGELEKLLASTTTARDQRLASYFYAEAVRALGHIQLMRVKTGVGLGLYHDGRLANKNLSDEGKAVLKEALGNLQACDRTTANCSVYADLAEAHLLLGDYGRAQGYARHATLGSPADERAFFLAAESSLLQDTADSKEVARKYAEGYTGPVRLDEFKALRKHLGISDQKAAAHVA